MKTEFDTLKELIKTSPYGFMKTLLGKKYEFLRTWLIEQTPKLDESFNFKTRIYWVLNGIRDFPKCECCGNDIRVNVHNVVIGYTVRTCCKKCRYTIARAKGDQTCIRKYGCKSYMQTEEFKDQTKTTCIEKYGVEHTSQIPGTAEKRKKTCKERYGVEVPMQSPAVVEKSKKTQIDKYGVDSYTKTEEYLEKTNKTCMERYGTMFPGQSDQAKQKKQKTCLQKYGVDSYSKTDEFIEKSSKTCLERYGTENVWQAGADGRKKAKNTCQVIYGDENYNNRPQAAETCREKYGADTPGENADIRRTMAVSRMKTNYKVLCENAYVIPMFSEEEYLNKTPDTVFKWKCLGCGNEFETKINWNYYKDHPMKTVARCLVCRPIGYAGSSEEEHDFINSIRRLYNGTVLERQVVLEDGTDRRHWKEIDCYLPDLKIGFEYDGIYFHQLSSYDDDSHKHMVKTELAEKQGIILVHVRSDEWLDNRQSLISMFKNIIGGNIEIDTTKDIIELDRSIYNKCILVPGYELIGETSPEKFEFWHSGRKYIYEDCGKLIYRKVKGKDENR